MIPIKIKDEQLLSRCKIFIWGILLGIFISYMYYTCVFQDMIEENIDLRLKNRGLVNILVIVGQCLNIPEEDNEKFIKGNEQETTRRDEKEAGK